MDVAQKDDRRLCRHLSISVKTCPVKRAKAAPRVKDDLISGISSDFNATCVPAITAVARSGDGH